MPATVTPCVVTMVTYAIPLPHLHTSSLSHTHTLHSPTPTHTADIISTVEFNHDGEFLATGDKGGRVVIFQRVGNQLHHQSESVYSNMTVTFSEDGNHHCYAVS